MKSCKTMKGATQQRTGPKGGKQWRCGNGPWKYGDPPKNKVGAVANDQTAASARAEKAKQDAARSAVLEKLPPGAKITGPEARGIDLSRPRRPMRVDLDLNEVEKVIRSAQLARSTLAAELRKLVKEDPHGYDAHDALIRRNQVHTDTINSAQKRRGYLMQELHASRKVWEA